MALPVVIPNTFANANASIPLSQLDNNFSTVAVAINGMANGAEALSNVNITGGSIANASLSNVSISSGNVTINVANVTTLDATNVEVTNIKSKDGTASATIADSTGVMTIGSSVLTTTDINGGTVDNTSIGATTPSTGAFTTLSASGVATFSAGSAAAPAITTSGDTNTGIFFPAADTIAFTEGGAEAMRIDSSGNVGIGTSSPTNQVQLGAASVIGQDANTLYVGANFKSNGQYINTNYASQLYFDQSTGNTVFRNAASGTAGNAISWSERMRIDSSGNVGIGTSSPGVALDILSGAPQIKLKGTGTTSEVRLNSAFGNAALGALGTVDNYPFMFYTNNTERMRIDSSGNMLLGGTATPASATASLAIFNGTAPTGSVTNGIVLYAEDVSSSSELKVRDEAGNVTTLSPHNFSLIPEGPSEDMAWAYYSEKGGKRINVDMLKLARMVEKLTGEKLVYEAQ